MTLMMISFIITNPPDIFLLRRYLLSKPLSRSQLFTQQHLQRLEHDHDVVPGDDSELVTDAGDDDQGDADDEY